MAPLLHARSGLETFKPSASLHRQLEQYLHELSMHQPKAHPDTLRLELIRLLYLAMLEPVNPARAYAHIFESAPALDPQALTEVIARLQWVRQLFHLEPENLGQLYEALLSLAKTGRKQAGSFFTPYPLAKAITGRLVHHLKARGDGPAKPLTVLDPAFGGGIFLQTLSETLDPQYLFGIDQDPGAVSTTRLMLWHGAGQPDRLATFMAHRLLLADALDTIPEDGEDPRFDAVIGNPPYLSVKQGLSDDRRKLYESRYRCASGQYDVYSLFLERGLELLEPGGVLAFLLPKPVLVNDQQRPVRELLLENRLLEIWDIGREAFSPQAAVESTVIILQKEPPEPGHAFVRMDWQEAGPVETGHIDQQTLGDFGEKSFNLWLVPENVAFLKTLESAGASLSEWITAPSGRGMEMGKNQCRRQPGPGLQPVLTGQEVLAFRLPEVAGFYAPFDPADAKKCKPAALYKAPKLIIRRVANRPIAAVDEADHWLTLNTLYNFHLNDPDLLKAACALINSETLHRWFIQRFYFTETLFPYLRQQQLLMLPLPTVERLHAPLPAPLKTGLFSASITGLQALDTLHDQLQAHEGPRSHRKQTLAQLDALAQHLYRL